MDNTKQPQRILSLCTGMRGLERGIERAGVDLAVASYVEIEAFIIWNLVKQMEQGVLAPAPIFSNLKTFPWQQFHGRIHGIIGGYPCQPFSCAGSRKGTEDPRHLWPYIKEGIHAVRPLWCFFENVPGHLTLGYEEVRNDLLELGYSVEEGIYSAEEVGAPHQRKRLFILACRGVDQVNSSRWGSRGIQDKTCKGEGYGITGSSGILDNSNRNGHKSEHEISTRRDIAELTSKEMADTDNTGSQRWDSAELPECSGEFTIRKIGSCERWPARPGEDQHEWEEPRTIEKQSFESCLGSATSRYNFREDLLRMLGNAVVEQTAEIAWIDLWNKIQPTTNK